MLEEGDYKKADKIQLGTYGNPLMVLMSQIGTGVVSIKLIVLIVGGAITGPVGIAAAAILAIYTIVAGELTNSISKNYSQQLLLDTSEYYSYEEATQTIDVEFLSDNEYSQDVVFDINYVYNVMGDRYKIFDVVNRKVEGKLVKDKKFYTETLSCDSLGLINYFPQSHYLEIIKQKNLGSFSFKEEGGKYIYSAKGDGSFPRKKINLEVMLYKTCRQPDEKWPQSIVAGLQPIEFNILSSDNNTLYTNLHNYKNFYQIFTFYAGDGSNNTPINDGRIRFEFHRKEIKEVPDYNREVVDCYTDSGKLGQTGEGAQPKVLFDWQWKDVDKKPVDCTEYYCDSTQMTIDVLSRIYEAQQIITDLSIECPMSVQQMIDEQLSSQYIYSATNDGLSQTTPPGSVGLDSVSLYTQQDNGDKFVVQTIVSNVTDAEKTVTLNVLLNENNTPITQNVNAYKLTWVEGSDEPVQLPITYNTNGMSFTVPAGQENTSEIIVEYLDIYSEDLDLIVNLSGTNVHLDFSIFTTDLDLYIHEGSNYNGGENCEVPATTAIISGTDMIDYWFINDYENIPTEVQELKQLLRYDAYMITDKYTESFMKAFDEAYNGSYAKSQPGYSPSNPYTYFTNTSYTDDISGQDNYLSELLRENSIFRKAYSNQSGYNNVEISTPGKYKVTIDLLFNNFDWKFVNNNEVDVSALITFNKLASPEDDSVFYRLPFNGPVGYTTQGYYRSGYGLAYLGEEVVVAPWGDVQSIETSRDAGSNPYKYLTVTTEDDFYKLNSQYETRGNVLSINRTNQDNYYEMNFSPNTPKVYNLEVTRDISSSFEVYYRLKKDNNYVYGNPSLLPWSGVSGVNNTNIDFSGGIITNVFNNRYDQITQTGTIAPQQTYHISWPNVQRTGSVVLRTIVYDPEDHSLEMVKSMYGQPGELTLENGTNISLENIKNIISNIQNKNICVTNKPNGEGSEFWWNPKQIYDDVNNNN